MIVYSASFVKVISILKMYNSFKIRRFDDIELIVTKLPNSDLRSVPENVFSKVTNSLWSVYFQMDKRVFLTTANTHKTRKVCLPVAIPWMNISHTLSFSPILCLSVCLSVCLLLSLSLSLSLSVIYIYIYIYVYYIILYIQYISIYIYIYIY